VDRIVELVAGGGAAGAARGVAVEGAPAIGVSTVLRDVAHAVRARGGSARLVVLPDSRPASLLVSEELILIDDAHLADGDQLAAVRDLALTCPVVLGVRAGAADDRLAYLWRSGAIEHVELAPMDRDEIAALATDMLGSGVHRTLVDDLARGSAGRPGFIVDELGSLRDDAQLVAGTGLLRSSPTAAIGRRLTGRARALLGALPPDLAHDVELLAVAGHLPADALADLGIDLPALRLRGLVGPGDELGRTVRLDPPTLERAVRAAIAPEHLRTLARTIHDACGDRLSTYDRVRVTFELGDHSDAIGVDELKAAAAAALSAHQPGEALELGQRAAGLGADGPLVLANLLADVGRRREAADVYAGLLDDERTDPIVRGIAASEYSLLLLWDLARPDEAMAVSLELAAAAAGTPFDSLGRVHLAATKLYGGRPVEALVALEGADRSTLDATLAHTLDMVEVTARAITDPASIGGPDAVDRMLGIEHTDQPMLIRPAVGAIAATLALELGGHWAAAEAVLAEYPPDRLSDRTTISLAWLALATGRTKLAVGRLAEARVAAAEAAAGFADVNHASGLRWARATAMMAAALAGDHAACRVELDAWQRLDPGAPFLDADLLRARAWAEWLVGNSAVAAALLDDASELAAASGAVGLEAIAQHDAFRMLRAPVRVRLTRLAERSPSPAIELRLRHVDAVARADAPALIEVAEQLEARGALLLAGEVAGDAVAIAEAAGLRTLARVAGALRDRLAADCGAATPSLSGQRTNGLTPRERDVCVLAAHGLASKEIAERLGVSVRTVDNLLQRSYVKLGVTGRSELAGRTL
jgi:DNA-binding CsgD family transcriptional regulator